MKPDVLGDRMKMYERQESSRTFIPGLPVYARVDGRSFSKFTKGMKRPYDKDMANAMIETTKALVKETNADIGYTQSDEISLVWYTSNPNGQIFFNGRIQKMTSQLAAIASVHFLVQAQKYWPEKVTQKLPTFDARVFNLPSLNEATNCFVWREWDATKNSISMAAQSVYSHKQLQYKGSKEKMDMLMDKGINWNDYPTFFKRGTYVQRVNRIVRLTQQAWDMIPDRHKPESREMIRSFIEEIEMPPISRVKNRIDVIFKKEKPILLEED